MLPDVYVAHNVWLLRLPIDYALKGALWKSKLPVGTNVHDCIPVDIKRFCGYVVVYFYSVRNMSPRKPLAKSGAD